MICQEVDELAGAFALGALLDDDRREVEEHLSSCSKHPDIAELRVVASSLALAAPEADAPPALKARIMDIVRTESATAGGVPVRRNFIDRLKGLVSRPGAPYALAGALATVTIALLAWNVTLQAGGDDTIERQFTAAGDARGSITYLPEQELVVLAVENFDPLPVSKTYQVWTISGNTIEGVGFLEVAASGRGATTIPLRLEAGQIVAVTVEPAGGSPQPTAEPVVAVEI